METPTPRNQPLFDLMAQDHGLTLTVSEMDDIEAIAARMLADDRRREAEHSAGPELGAALGSAAYVARETSAAENCPKCGIACEGNKYPMPVWCRDPECPFDTKPPNATEMSYRDKEKEHGTT